MSNNQQPLTLVESLTAFAQAIGRDIKEIKDLIKGRPAQGGQETSGSQAVETAPTTKPAEGGLQVFTVIPSKHFAYTNFFMVESKDGGPQVVNKGESPACGVGYGGYYDVGSKTMQPQTLSFNKRSYTNNIDVNSDNYDDERAKFIEFLKTDRSGTDNFAYVEFLNNNKIVFNPATQSMVLHYGFTLDNCGLLFANAQANGELRHSDHFGDVAVVDTVLFEFEEGCPKPTIPVTQYPISYGFNEYFNWSVKLLFDTDGKVKLSMFVQHQGSAAFDTLRRAGILDESFNLREEHRTWFINWIFTIYNSDTAIMKNAKRDLIRAVQRTYHGSIVLM